MNAKQHAELNEINQMSSYRNQMHNSKCYNQVNFS